MRNRLWHHNYDYSVPTTIRYPHIPIRLILDMAVSKYKDWAAIDFFGREITYRELKKQVNELAYALQGLGIKKGERVGLMLPNCPQVVIGYYGVLSIGAIVVNVNPMYTVPELEYQARDSGMETIFCLETDLDKIRKIKKSTSIKRIVVSRMGDFMPLEKQDTEAGYDSSEGEFGLVELLNNASDKPAPIVEVDVNGPALLQYTGGTTGVSKGAILSHKNIVSNTLQMAVWIKEILPRDQPVFLIVIPIFHSYGMTCGMNAGIFHGARMVLIPRFEIENVLDAITMHDITYFPTVPTMLNAILHHPRVTNVGLGRIALVNSGSAALPVGTINKLRSLGISLTEGYGLSEASPVTHSTPILGLRKPGSIGVPFPDTDARIVDLEDWQKELPVGSEGELIVKGPQIMIGYWNRPEETVKALKNGWLLTGDIVRMDGDGYFYVVGRKKDLIIAGGYNIYPREIDEVLYQHPKVAEVATVGIPDEYRGETVKAFIVVKEGETLTEEEVFEFCKEKLAPYKRPKMIEFRKELPKSTVGKVLRKALRAEEEAKMKGR